MKADPLSPYTGETRFTGVNEFYISSMCGPSEHENLRLKPAGKIGESIKRDLAQNVNEKAGQTLARVDLIL